jgi:Tol biopolymer transport system component/predicted Ser/Thr protein kinase
MSERMAHYEVREKIGEGGMGAVFLARDTRLQRDVALKVLPPAFLQDAERLARFEREAQLLAQLSHPHVAQVYGFEEHEGQRFLVMEYVPGVDLTERLTRGRIPVEEAVRLARQIAEALEAAHEAGIVHRDLKPSNVRITPEDGVKVLDFGLAKALEGDPNQSSSDLSMSPTITGMMTSANVILGTAAYMSPEQARGKKVDRRADIWAFGAVLYEMLTGKQAFPGETVSDVLAAVLKTEPDRDELPDDTPPALRRLVDRCLLKDPRERLRDIGEARILLAGPMDEPAEVAPAAEPARANPLPWIAALVAVALAVGAGAWLLKPVPDRPLLSYEIVLPEHLEMVPWDMQVVSPDGKWIAFTATDSTRNFGLYVRAANSSEARRLDGATEPALPFWSPDSRQIAYWNPPSGRLNRISLEGGAPVPICEATSMRGGTWSEDGTILVAPRSNGPLYRVPASGGELEPVTAPDTTSNASHRWPEFLPGGDRFLYLDAYGSGESRVMAGSLSDPGLREEILTNGSQALFSDGHLFFVRDDILHAQEFDPASLALGDVRVVTNGVYTVGFFSRSLFSVRNGVVTYIPSRDDVAMRGGAVEFDVSGNEVATYDFGGRTDDLTVTTDGARLAAMVGDQTGNNDIWVLDTERGIKNRVSFNESSDDPVFSPDGREVVYSSAGDLARRRVDAATEAEIVLDDDRDKVPHQWTKDNEIIYCTGGNPEALCRLDLDTGEDTVLRSGEFRYVLGQVSPDGKWIAYVCDETGNREVYVENYPAMDNRVRISRNQGTFPRWTHGGTRLWYMDRDRGLHEATLEVVGDDLRVVADEIRFTLPTGAWSSRTHQIGITGDGTRVFALRTEDVGGVGSIIRVLNGWRPEE